ncbi:ensconsin isoform X9 [Glossina fuscipes]|uniref:Ensconsin isoform X9 n=1 Tax=Glossina fuscipes TaxID=7396 RepID=A0A9C6E4D4_9MUSC|nr:ensconsin isoform X9 [Glossina fuscipes]
MASLGGEQKMSSNSPAGDVTKQPESREGSVERNAAKERDDKLKVARERQNEERQRKIEELKAQAEAAQRYREQKEEERRRRIEEIRHRDSEKRLQVEERKKAIMEAEKERREYILRKNQERETRLELKKRERNSYGYAFGSSTPRLLEPADFGMVSPSTFWGQRRSTSISNVAGASLSRRSSERELNDSGTKKRATSASGTERHDEDNVDTSHIVFRSVARRKTDLMPTIPSPRDGHYGSRSSLSTPRTPGSRSGNVTPGGQLTSRPGSSMSTSTTMSTSGFITRRSMPTTRKPRPSSIAGTGVSLEEINKLKKESKPPMKTITPSTSAQTTPKRSTNMMSTSLIVTSSSRLSSAEKKTPNKRDSVTPKATTPKPLSTTSSTDRLHKINREKPKDLTTSMTRSAIMSTPANKTVPKDNKEPLTKSKEEKEALNQVKTEVLSNNHNTDTIKSSAQKNGAKERKMSGATAQEEEKTDQGTEKESDAIVREKPKSHNSSKEGSLVREFGGGDSHDSMTASMIAKSKITTEEEAKAALAERRRWAREEAERQAELERQRLEAERLAEIKRQEEETERQRQFEEEAIRLAEEQREAEEERLRQAIEEAKHREEEEKRKREEDEKQRLEREETEKKAKEEAEKQRLVVAERLKREEKEREERRKRVEAIMSRTRRGGGNNSTPSSTPSKENNNIMKTAVITPNAATITPQENQEQLTAIHNATSATTITSISVNSDSNSTSGSSSATATTPTAINNTVALPVMPASTEQNAEEIKSQFEPQNSQAMYEQSVIDKENSLINSFSNLIIDENAKNIHQQPQQQQQQQQQQQRIHHQFVVEEKNAKKLVELQNNETKNILTTNAVANGNGHHIDSINNKNEIDLIQNVVPTANQLINLSLDTQDNVNFNNNNSLLTTTTTALVTADSHENKDISLL